jgi:peptidoglycan/LPS O-acetylase OafA/YrhL
MCASNTFVSADSHKIGALKEYRHDIDGMRAISVILVILYHLRLSWVPSGFIGVDVFFVISGFLITSHIYNDIKLNVFSLGAFYLKRVRRILPALAFVLFCTSIAAWLLLLPKDLIVFSKTLVSALLSISNIYFYKRLNFGYFASDSSIIPLLHTWSLGVEEQFYLVWPLVLLLLCGFFRNYILIFITFAIALLSLVFYLYSNTDFSYYMPFTRAFQLLIGALLALSYDKIKCMTDVTSKLGILVKTFLINALSLFAIFGILGSALLIKAQYFHGIISLLPCLSAAVLIALGGNRIKPFGNRLMSVKPLVLVGVISYSLYLWHWPIIAYVNYFGIELNFLVRILIVVIAFLLSFLTYKMIEIPFRYKFKFNLYMSVLFYLLLPLTLSLIFLYCSVRINSFAFNRISDKQYQQANAYYGILQQKFGCIDNEGGGVLPAEKLCTIGDLSAKKPEVLVVGDSHAMADVAMLDVFLKNAKLSAYVVTQSGSPFVLGAGIIDWRGNKPVERSQAIANLIKENHYKYVIISGFWNYYSVLPSEMIKSPKPFEVFKAGFINAVQFVVKNHSIPIILFDNPSTEDLKRYCGLTKIQIKLCYNKKNEIASQQAITNQILYSIKKEFPSTIFIDPGNIICDKLNCYLSYHGVPFYMSDGFNSHLSYAGSEIIGELYLKRIGNPLSSVFMS